MPSQLAICNMALAHIGKAPITSINDATESARKCLLFYDNTKKAVLRRIDWPFARTAEALGLIDLETIPGWSYLYTYPSDAVLVRKILIENASSTDKSYDWIGCLSPVTATKSIACNVSDAYAEYTANILDPTQFDPLFVDAFAAKLAATIAQPLTGSQEVVKYALGIYQFHINEAAVVGRNEEKNPKDIETKYISARG